MNRQSNSDLQMEEIYIEGHAKLQLFIPTYGTGYPGMWKK